MIIVEGGDLSGKSTLSGKLSPKPVHLGLPEAGARHWDLAKKHLTEDSDDTVYDRCVVGSIVYGKIKDDEPNKYPVTPEELRKFCNFVERSRSVIIWVCCSQAAVIKRYNLRGDSYLTLNEILRAHALYSEIMQEVRNLTDLVICRTDEDYGMNHFLCDWRWRLNQALSTNPLYTKEDRIGWLK